jgi:DNA-binding NarL/FixJ family response regulator
MSDMNPVRCMVVDDDELLRNALADELEAMGGVEVVATAGDLEEALTLTSPVDVVLLDLSLPGSCRRTATETVLGAWPHARVLVITAYATGPDVVQAFAEGARGYLTKHARSDELAAAIRAVAAGGTYVTPTLAGHLLNAGLRLSRGERAVLRYVAEGLTDKQVAAVLHISDKTVENRLASVRVKAGLVERSRSLLTRFAYESDPFCLLDADEHEEKDRRLGRRRRRRSPKRHHGERSQPSPHSGPTREAGSVDGAAPLM